MSQPLPENPPETRSEVGPGHPPEEHRFPKGKSGNPGGRPKGLARKVRETLGNDDGEALTGFWVSVLSGELRTIRTKVETDDQGKTVTRQETVYEEVSVADRITISKILAERGWGKPAQFVPIEDDDPLDFSDADAAEMAQSFDARMDELARKRRARADRAPEST